MKLVSIHKHLSIVVLILFFIPAINAQKIWTLEQCIDTAKSQNKQLSMSAGNVDAAKEFHSASRAQLIPKLMVNADYKYFTNLPYQLMPLSVFGGPEGQFKETQFGVPHNVTANLQLNAPIYNPQIYGKIETAKKVIKLRELMHQKTAEEVFFEVSNFYYNAQIINTNLAFLDSNINNTQRVLKNTVALLEHSLAKKSDVSKVQLKLDQLNNQRDQAKSQSNQLLNALKFLMGIDLDAELQVEEEFHFQSKNEYDAKETVDLKIAQTKLSLASTELKTVKQSRLPSLSIFGSFGTTGFGYDQEPNSFLNFYPLGFAGLKLSYPLFNGTVTQRMINEKSIAEKNAQTYVEYAQGESRLEFENALLKLNAAYSNILQTEKQVNFAQEIFNQTMEEYQQGLANLTEVTMSDSELQQAQMNYLNAVIEYLKADLSLKKLSGNFELK